MSSERWYYIRKHSQPKPTAADRYRERRQRRQRQLHSRAAIWVTVEMIADPANLIDVFRTMQREAGPGAGIDGVRLPDVTVPEVGRLAEAYSKLILAGHYRPQPTRALPIPKGEPGKFRVLSIPTLMDRVIAKALADALTPSWEGIFTDSVWAYRPGRSTWQMLAKLLETMERTGRTVLVIDDIANAFDRVPIRPLMDVHRRMVEGLLPNELKTEVEQAQAQKRLLDFIRRVITGSTPSRQRGIPQGGNYSPLALNALLHDALDAPIITKSQDTLWYRYSDNLLYLAQSAAEGNEKLAEIRSLLAPLGMSLKGATEDGVLDLATGGQAQLLGFVIRSVKRQTILGFHAKALDWLREDFRSAYATDNPPETANGLLAGWIRAYGPAFVNGGLSAVDIFDLAAQEGFREMASPDTVQRWIDDSRAAWQRTRITGRLAP